MLIATAAFRPLFSFDRLVLGGVETAARIGGAERGAAKSALTKKLTMLQTALALLITRYRRHSSPAVPWRSNRNARSIST